MQKNPKSKGQQHGIKFHLSRKTEKKEVLLQGQAP